MTVHIKALWDPPTLTSCERTAQRLPSSQPAVSTANLTDSHTAASTRRFSPNNATDGNDNKKIRKMCLIYLCFCSCQIRVALIVPTKTGLGHSESKLLLKTVLFYRDSDLLLLTNEFPSRGNSFLLNARFLLFFS